MEVSNTNCTKLDAAYLLLYTFREAKYQNTESGTEVPDPITPPPPPSLPAHLSATSEGLLRLVLGPGRLRTLHTLLSLPLCAAVCRSCAAVCRAAPAEGGRSPEPAGWRRPLAEG